MSMLSYICEIILLFIKSCFMKTKFQNCEYCVHTHTHTHTHGRASFRSFVFFALLLVFLMSNSGFYAQNPCVYDVSNSNLLLNKFVPDSSTPIKTIHLSFHVWRDDNGLGNFWLNTQAYRDTLRMVIGYLNWIYSENVAFSDPISNAVFIPDTKVRFELDSVYYYDNTTYCNYGIDKGGILTNYLNINFPERIRSFPYHLTIRNIANPFGQSSGFLSLVQNIITWNQNTQAYANNDGGMFFMLALHMAHEFGHNFNLGHPYNSEVIEISNTEFLWDLFGSQRQSWCNSVGIDSVCYHDAGWSCNPYDTSNTCTNNIMGGTSSARHFTALQCARIHRCLSVNPIRNYAKGYSSTPLNITENQTWDHGPKMYQDIVIKNGATLTLTCELIMPYQSKIIIERGGKLVLNGQQAKITNSCGELWKGIEVWGTSNKSQYAVDYAHQGQLIIINGGTIENAIVGVYVGKTNIHGFNETGYEGGIVMVENARFINNKIAVLFNPYHNYLPSNPLVQKPNHSYFYDCLFQTNSGMTRYNQLPEAFVKIKEVEGLKFKGCRFENTDHQNYVVYNRGKGIVATDAYFYLDLYCAVSYPCPNPINCSFSNLYYAIDATKTFRDDVISILKSTFNSNYRGIYLSGILNPIVSGNTFSISDYDPNIVNVLPNDNQPYGLYLNNSTGYTVDYNTFNSATSNKSTKIGVVVNNSGTANNLIYNNVFTGLNVGSQAQSINRGTNTGLVYKCNEFTSCNRDLNIEDGRIAQYQGSTTVPAANLFSHARTYCSDILNSTSSIIYYHNTTTSPIPRWVPRNYSTTVTLYNTSVAYNKQVQCPAQSSGGTNKNLQNAYHLIYDLSSEINTAENQLNALIDGGSTIMVLEEVANSPTWNALQLRNNLLNKSPFLSDTVLATTVESESALPPLMLTQVLTANPQGIKSQQVAESIENRQNTIPEYLMIEIENGRNNVSAKEHMESRLSTIRITRSLEVNKLINTLKKDTLNPYVSDSICQLMNYDFYNNTTFNQMLRMLQSSKDEQALSYLNTILNSNDDDQKFIAQLAYRITNHIDVIDSLPTEQYSRLFLISQDSLSSVQHIARNILLSLEKINYNEPITESMAETDKSKTDKNKKTIKDDNVVLKIYPNPAKDYVIIYFKSENSDGIIEICDVTGKTIFKQATNKKEGELLIETKSYTSGSYFVRFNQANRVMKTEKLNISNH